MAAVKAGRHARPDAMSNTLARQRRNSGKHRAVEQPVSDEGTLRVGSGRNRSRNRVQVPRTVKSYSGVLVAEWFAGVALASVNVMVGQDAYHDRIVRWFIQTSALTAVFFMLALVAQSEKSGKFVAAFGGLIDVAILFDVSRRGLVKNTNDALHGDNGQEPSSNTGPNNAPSAGPVNA